MELKVGDIVKILKKEVDLKYAVNEEFIKFIENYNDEELKIEDIINSKYHNQNLIKVNCSDCENYNYYYFKKEELIKVEK